MKKIKLKLNIVAFIVFILFVLSSQARSETSQLSQFSDITIFKTLSTSLTKENIAINEKLDSVLCSLLEFPISEIQGKCYMSSKKESFLGYNSLNKVYFFSKDKYLAGVILFYEGGEETSNPSVDILADELKNYYPFGIVKTFNNKVDDVVVIEPVKAKDTYIQEYMSFLEKKDFHGFKRYSLSLSSEPFTEKENSLYNMILNPKKRTLLDATFYCSDLNKQGCIQKFMFFSLIGHKANMVKEE